MKSEILEAIGMLAREKDISEEMLVATVEEAIKTAYRRHVTTNASKKAPLTAFNLSVVLNSSKGIQVLARKVIVEQVEDDAQQISLAEAQAISPDYTMGDIVEIDVTPANFGRVAAQSAKQVLMQRLRDVERGKIYDEYIEKENEILTAIVQRVEAKAVYVELGRTEGVLEMSEFMPGEAYHEGDHIKVYVLEVQRNGRDFGIRGPQVRVSRVHPGLIKRLFEIEVPEIMSGTVQIKSIAREAGSRTKMAVYSSDMHIDPVGACVGPRGSRVDKVVSELKNEKIDIIKWSSDPAEFVANALNPAHVLTVFISEREKMCRVIVPDHQLSLAIGKEGQNARLAARLTGWKIDIKSHSQAQEMMGALDENGLPVSDEDEGQLEEDGYEPQPQTEEPIAETATLGIQDVDYSGLVGDEDDTM